MLGHDGNLGNEKIDMLTKKGSKGGSITNSVEPPIRHHKQEIVGNIRKAWAMKW